MTIYPHFIREHIQSIPAYQPIIPGDVLAEELGITPDKLIKLDANENPFGPLPQVSAELGRLASLHQYPDPEARQIRKLLSDFHKIPEEHFVIGAGADELIDLILRLLIDPGDAVINCPPTFGMYAFDGQLNQARMVDIPRKADFSLDLDAIMRAVAVQHPKIIFLANPNNPDGGLTPHETVRQIATLPALLVIDEAYIEFSNSPESGLALINTQTNVVVLRTLSKWAGLAGLRIGYGIFPKPLAAALRKAKQPYNVSVAAERAAVITMQSIDEANRRLALIRELRGKFSAELAQIPWLKPYPSDANFILSKVAGISAGDVKNKLRKKGILIRHFRQPGLDDCIRISIGTPDQMEVVVNELTKMR